VSGVPVGPAVSVAPPSASTASAVAEAPIESPQIREVPQASPPPVDPLVKAVQEDIAEEERRHR